MPAPSVDRFLTLQRTAGNTVVAGLVARMKIPEDTAAGTELDTDAADFEAQVNAINDLAVLRRMSVFITANTSPTPSANDVAAATLVLDRRKAVLDGVKTDTENATRRVLDAVIAGTTEPDAAILLVDAAREAAERVLTDTVKSDAQHRAHAIEIRKGLAQITTDLRSRLVTYAKKSTPRTPPAREFFKDAKALTVGTPLHRGTDAERDAVRRRHPAFFTALSDTANLDADAIELIVDSLLHPKDGAEAEKFAAQIAPTIRSWPAIKLPGLQQELRNLKGDRAAWKGTTAALVHVDWEVQAGHVDLAKKVSLGSRKAMKDQVPGEVDQDIDVSFVDATDMVRRYHEVKADPSALLSKAKTVGTVEGAQIQHYRRVKEKREADKGKPRKIRFVCVGTRGWTSLQDNGVLENIEKAGMELQLGPTHIYDGPSLRAFRLRLEAFADKELAGKETLDRFEYRTKRWPTPAEFETDFTHWLTTGSLPAGPSSSATSSSSSSPSPPVPASTILSVGQRLTYTDDGGDTMHVTVLAIRDVPGKVRAPDPGPDDAVARLDTRVYVKRDGGKVMLVQVAKLST